MAYLGHANVGGGWRGWRRPNIPTPQENPKKKGGPLNLHENRRTGRTTAAMLRVATLFWVRGKSGDMHNTEWALSIFWDQIVGRFVFF